MEPDNHPFFIFKFWGCIRIIHLVFCGPRESNLRNSLFTLVESITLITCIYLSTIPSMKLLRGRSFIEGFLIWHLGSSEFTKQDFLRICLRLKFVFDSCLWVYKICCTYIYFFDMIFVTLGRCLEFHKEPPRSCCLLELGLLTT